MPTGRATRYIAIEILPPTTIVATGSVAADASDRSSQSALPGALVCGAITRGVLRRQRWGLGTRPPVSLVVLAWGWFGLCCAQRASRPSRQ